MGNSSLEIEIQLTANAAVLKKAHGIVPEWLGMSQSSPNKWGENASLALAMQANVESLGHSFTLDALRALSQQSRQELKSIYVWLDGALRKELGAHREFRPMYPNFPEQVISASDEELLRNAAEHYAGDWVGARVLPDYQKKTRAVLDLKRKPEEIRLLSDEDALAVFRQLLNSGACWSKEDQSAAKAFARLWSSSGVLARELRSEIALGQKENLAVLASAALRTGNLDDFAAIKEKFATATDILRLAVGLSDGDVSLAQPSRFGKISRSERKKMLGLLEFVLSKDDPEQVLENMFGRKDLWIRLGERLHPGEFAEKNPRTIAAFKKLRDGARPIGFASKAKALIDAQDIRGATALLETRPGFFARSLGLLLRKGGEAMADETLAAFDRCAPAVSTQVLLQALAYFKAAPKGGARVFMPKGGLGKVFVSAKPAEALPEGSSERAVEICEKTLIARFSGLSPLGKSYVDPALDEQNVPFATRSAARSLQTWARGSKAHISGDITRFFIWWSESGKNQEGVLASTSRVDVDLSCALLSKDFDFIGHCSWTDLRGNGLTHSGDITSAPNGACEFIDVDYGKLDPNVAYVAMTVNVFTGQTYDALPECFAGWMSREKSMSGEIFDPRTVLSKLDLAAKATGMLPVILDVSNKKAIWADLALKKVLGWNTVEAQSKTISQVTRGLVEMTRPNLRDLFELHARARGELVETPAEADTVFSMAQGITPSQSDKILGEFVSVPIQKIEAPRLAKKPSR